MTWRERLTLELLVISMYKEAHPEYQHHETTAHEYHCYGWARRHGLLTVEEYNELCGE